jgi:hypothetical protein
MAARSLDVRFTPKSGHSKPQSINPPYFAGYRLIRAKAANSSRKSAQSDRNDLHRRGAFIGSRPRVKTIQPRAKGKPLSDRQVAKLLSSFTITSETVHPPGESHAKGYKLERFADAFTRYLRPQHTPNRTSGARKRASADETGTSDDFATVRARQAHGNERPT